MEWKVVVTIMDGTAYGAFGSDGSAVISASIHHQRHILQVIKSLSIHSDSVELSGIVPVKRTVTMVKASNEKARDLHRYSSNPVTNISFESLLPLGILEGDL